MLASASTGRLQNKIDLDAGSGKPFPRSSRLRSRRPGTSIPSTRSTTGRRPFISATTSPARPALGIGFGTGDRDDITSNLEPTALTYKQRFYYVVDRANTVTRTESDLYDITSPTAASTSTVPANGWFIELAKGERIIADLLTANGVIFFTTFNPNTAGNRHQYLSQNAPDCGTRERNGPAVSGVLFDRKPLSREATAARLRQFGGFLSEPVYFQSQNQQGNIILTN